MLNLLNKPNFVGGGRIWIARIGFVLLKMALFWLWGVVLAGY
jgi:hypothetical protein